MPRPKRIKGQVILRNATPGTLVVPLRNRFVPVASGAQIELSADEFEATYLADRRVRRREPMWEFVGTAVSQRHKLPDLAAPKQSEPDLGQTDSPPDDDNTAGTNPDDGSK